MYMLSQHEIPLPCNFENVKNKNKKMKTKKNNEKKNKCVVRGGANHLNLILEVAERP